MAEIKKKQKPATSEQPKPRQNDVKGRQSVAENDQAGLTSAQMKGESSRQYYAWLLYTQIGSIRKLLELWDHVGELEGGTKYVSHLKKRPGRTTIEKWSKKFHWVKRTELQFEETLTELAEKTKKIDRERKDKVAELFRLAMDRKLKQLQPVLGNPGEPVTDTLLNYLWKMHRIEMGLPTDYSKHDIFTPINEDEQKPLTPEEEELSAKITQLEKEHNDKIN